MIATQQGTPSANSLNRSSPRSGWSLKRLDAWLANQPLAKQIQPTPKAAGLASAASLGVALSGALLFPPLKIMSIATTAYAALPIFKTAYQTLRRQHKVNQAVADSAVVLTCFATNHFVVAAMAVGLHHLGDKLLAQHEAHHHPQHNHSLQPRAETVWVRVAGDVVPVLIADLKMGDELLLEAGEVCTVAGTISEGAAWVEQVASNNDAQTICSQVGAPIPAGAQVLTGQLCVKIDQPEPAQAATQAGRLSSTLPTPLRQQTPSPDRLAAPMLVLSALSLPLLGAGGAGALLNTGKGDNLRHLLTMQQLDSSEQALAAGILIKEAQALSTLNQVNAVVFDLAALCEPAPGLEEIYTYQNISENEVLAYATAAAHSQMHPLLNVLAPEAQARRLHLPAIECVVEPKTEGGIRAWVEHKQVYVGDPLDLARAGVPLPTALSDFNDFCRQSERRALLVMVDNDCYGALEFRYRARPEVAAALRQLHQFALPAYVIRAANSCAAPSELATWAIDQVFDLRSGQQRSEIISSLQRKGKTVCYIGNGVTQYRAMQQADVSISVAGPAALPYDTAQIHLLDKKLAALGPLFTLAKQADARLKQNALMTLLPNAICMGGIILGGWGLGASVTANALGLLIGMSRYR